VVSVHLRARLLEVQAGFLLRRANRRRRRALAAELAAYTSQSDLNDLGALLDSYPDGQTQEIRDILAGQQLARHLSRSRR
jgi:hypothetical protein